MQLAILKLDARGIEFVGGAPGRALGGDIVGKRSVAFTESRLGAFLEIFMLHSDYEDRWVRAERRNKCVGEVSLPPGATKHPNSIARVSSRVQLGDSRLRAMVADLVNATRGPQSPRVSMLAANSGLTCIDQS